MNKTTWSKEKTANKQDWAGYFRYETKSQLSIFLIIKKVKKKLLFKALQITNFYFILVCNQS